jgi:hypothetical protein
MLLPIERAFSRSNVAEPASAKSSSRPTSPVMSDCVAWNDSSSRSLTCRSRSSRSCFSRCLISASSFLSNLAGLPRRTLGGSGRRRGAGGLGLTVDFRTAAPEERGPAVEEVDLRVVFFVFFFAADLFAEVVFFSLRLVAVFFSLRLVAFFAVFFGDDLVLLRVVVLFCVFLEVAFLAADFRAVDFLAVLREAVLPAPAFLAVVRLDVFLAGFRAGLMAAGR